MTEYGITGLRDKDGDLQAVDHSYEWNGDEILIKLRPPTIAEVDEIENLDEDAGPEELEAILDRHIIKPDIDGSYTAPEMWAFIEGILDYSTGGQSNIADEIAEEIDKRSGAEGN